MNCILHSFSKRLFKRIIVHFSISFFIFAAFVSGFFAHSASLANESSRILLLAFTSEGCPACRALEPLVSALEQKSYPIHRISPSGSADSQLYDRYGISTMPSFVLLVDGVEQSRFISRGEDIQYVQTRLLEMFQNASSSLTQRPAEKEPSPESNSVSSSLDANTPSPQETVSNNIRNSKTQNSQNPAAAQALASTVRLKIAGNSNETDTGTGTLIHTNYSGKSGEGLILTCGHLFRETEGKSPVLVDIFQSETGKITTVTGECVFYDDDLDIGFVGIPLPFPIEPVPLAPQDYTPKPGDNLFSVGCTAGKNPTVWKHTIRSTDQKFYQPRDPQSTNQNFYFIEVTNAPEPGRSGGGLFTQTADGQSYLLGVCNAGDPQTDEGYFLPFSVVYNQLYINRNLTFVYNDIISNQAAHSENIQQVSFDSEEKTGSPQEKIRQPKYERNTPEEGVDNTESKLQEIRNLLDQGAEVFCIINWPQDNSGHTKESEMIKLKGKK